jgi:hypothetical protein
MRACAEKSLESATECGKVDAGRAAPLTDEMSCVPLSHPIERLYTMQSVFVRFLTEEDRARGFAILAKRARISSLPGQVYQIPIDGLTLLESDHVGSRGCRTTVRDGRLQNRRAC